MSGLCPTAVTTPVPVAVPFRIPSIIQVNKTDQKHSMATYGTDGSSVLDSHVTKDVPMTAAAAAAAVAKVCLRIR